MKCLSNALKYFSGTITKNRVMHRNTGHVICNIETMAPSHPFQLKINILLEKKHEMKPCKDPKFKR